MNLMVNNLLGINSQAKTVFCLWIYGAFWP